jgi:hypothetical protein
MVVDRSGLRAKEHKAKFSPCVWLKHLYPLVKIIHCKYIYIYLRFRGPRVQISLRVRLKCNENVLENQYIGRFEQWHFMCFVGRLVLQQNHRTIH